MTTVVRVPINGKFVFPGFESFYTLVHANPELALIVSPTSSHANGEVFVVYPNQTLYRIRVIDTRLVKASDEEERWKFATITRPHGSYDIFLDFEAAGTELTVRELEAMHRHTVPGQPTYLIRTPRPDAGSVSVYLTENQVPLLAPNGKSLEKTIRQLKQKHVS